MHDDHPRFGKRPPPLTQTGVSSPKPRQWPFWPLPLLAIIPAYLLQQVPLLNILLLILLSPFWIGALLNGALIGMVVDVRRGAAPKALLIVPVAVYGLTLAASAVSYGRYRVLDQRITRENASQHLPFDPARMSLVAPQDLAQDLVQSYQLPVTYDDRPYGDTGRPLAYRVLPRAACDTIPRSPQASMLTQQARIDDSHADNACLLQLPAVPPLPVYTVENPDRFAPRGGLEHVTLTAPDGRRARLRRGTVPVLLPVPFPIIFCVTWTNGLECKHEMSVGLPAGLSSGQAGDGGGPWIASVLDLKPRATTASVGRARAFDRSRHVLLDEAQTQRLAAGSEAAVIEAQGLGQKIVEDQFVMLSRMVAGQPPGGRFEPWLVAKNADRLDRSQAEALVAALARGPGGALEESERKNLGWVAAALKPEVFAQVGPELISSVAADPALQDVGSLVVRLGDLGAPATPTLVSLLGGARGMDRTSAILGLCRAGRDARSAADPVLAAARAMPSEDNLQAGVVALLRMGRPDLAAALADQPIAGGLNEAGRRHHRQWADKALTTMGPDSPRSTCAVRWGDSNFELADVPWLKD